MSLNQKIEIDRFDGGLITDIESAKLPGSAASRLENADIRNRFLETLPGVAEVNTGLPAGFIKLSEEQFKFTSPSEQNCVLVHGTLSGVHKLYVRPYLSLAGAWVDSWQDLTEAETGLTADAGSGGDVTDTTHIVDAGLSSTTTDYYKSWIVYNTSRSAGAIVTAYNGSTKKLTLSWAIASQTNGDNYFISRNPIFLSTGVSLFDPDDTTGVRFLARDNAVAVVTGSDNRFDNGSLGIKADLLLTVQNSYEGFDDTDLNFTGFFLSWKPPATMIDNNLFTASYVALAAGEEALPVPTSAAYIVLPVAVYDGYQEGHLQSGASPFDGTRYSSNGVVSGLVTSRKLRLSIDLYYGKSSTPVPLSIAFGDQHSAQYLIFDKRITSIRFYMAEGTLADTTATKYYPSSEWRLVKQIDVDSSDWSGSGPNYTQTVDITGSEWSGAEGIDIADRQGHSSLKIHPNAVFIAAAKTRVAVANVFADKRRQSFVFFSAINNDTVNTPDVIPFTSFIDLSLYGIPKIIGFVEALGFYVAFGENQIVKIDAADLSVEKNIQARGLCSSNAITNAGGLIYFCSLDDIYYFHPAAGEPRSITTGYIREAWRTIATATKQAAAIGYDSRYNMLVVAAGSTIYLYNLPAAYADTLARDTQAVGAWSVYSVSKTFTRFYTDLTGKCIGIASDGKAYEFFSSGVANSLVYEKVLGETSLNVSGLRLTYEATSAITAKIFDMARNASFPIKTYRFPAQSLHRRVDIFKGAQTRKPKLRIEASVGTKISQVIINPDILSDDH